MSKKRKKRSLTLIEVMIVILLIGLIGGALAYNMRGSMDQGRAFKSEQNISRVYDLLMLEASKGSASIAEIAAHPKEYLDNSPFAKDGATLLKDGWGDQLSITVDNDEIIVTSSKLKAWKNRNGTPQ